MEIGERTRDCSPGHAGKEGPHIAMTGASRAFSRGAVPGWGFSQDTMGSSGVSRVVTGKTGLHARVEGERVIALESW